MCMCIFGRYLVHMFEALMDRLFTNNNNNNNNNNYYYYYYYYYYYHHHHHHHHRYLLYAGYSHLYSWGKPCL